MDISKLSYKELLLFATSKDFYNHIITKNEVKEFMSVLHRAYCMESKIKPTRVEISYDLENNTYGCYSYADRVIYINGKLLDVFYDCKDSKNSYYPYALITTIIHESRHLWQHLNLKKMYDKGVSDREKLSLYSIDKKMNEVKKAPKVKAKRNKGNALISFGDLSNIVENIFLGFELELEYSNCPGELDAEEEAMKALMYIYKTTKSKDALNIILNYGEKIRTTDGLWFLSHEYYEDKDKPYSKKAFEVIKEVYMNYLKRSIEEHKQGNHFYHEEEYVRELYPTIETVAKTIETIGYRVPELNDDAKKIIGLFSSNKKLLKSGK